MAMTLLRSTGNRRARALAAAVSALGLMTLSSDADPPASRPAEPPLVGLRVHHALIPQSIGFLEQGKAQDAVELLKDAIRRAGRGARGQLNELRLGLGLALLRSGDVGNARKTLLPLSKLKDGSDVCRRAVILCGIAARIGKPGPGTASLLTREAWRSALVIAMDELTAQLTAEHQKMSAAIAGHRWAEVHRGLDAIHDIQDRAAVFDLDELRLRQADLVADHARALAVEVRDINVAIAELIHQASDLGGQMTMKYDSNSKRRGYLPADVVARHNAVIDDITAANAAGEKLVTEYAKAVAASAGRVKRDAAVKMSKSRLPAKKPAFGR